MSETRLNTGLDRLGRDECLTLLGTAQVGRLVMVGPHGRPEIFPVNYVLDREAVVFATDTGTKLSSVSGPVAFEVDHLDPAAGSVWSVVIHGTAHRLGSEAQVSLPRWVVSSKPHLVTITPTEITGRRISNPS